MTDSQTPKPSRIEEIRDMNEDHKGHCCAFSSCPDVERLMARVRALEEVVAAAVAGSTHPFSLAVRPMALSDGDKAWEIETKLRVLIARLDREDAR